MDNSDLQNAGLMPLEGDTIAAFARLPTFENPAVRPAYLAHVVLLTSAIIRAIYPIWRRCARPAAGAPIYR